MITANLPSDEESRLKDLLSYDILDTKPELDFDDLVELAAQICKCPISLISLLDKDRQWFKARKGLEATHTSRDIAFCSHAILEENIFTVEDAAQDNRFNDNPLVTGDLNIRFYAGAPIISPGGYKLGTICVIDHTPKKLTAEEERALMLLSNQATKLIELRNKNILIRKRSEELVSIKSNAITTFFQNNREVNKAIAVNLHEGLAQEIAASLFYLDMAKDKPEESLQLINKTKVILESSLEKARDISYTIAPIIYDWVSIEDLIKEYIEKVSSTFIFKIQFSSNISKNDTSSGKTTILIQIIEKWLIFLANTREISVLAIFLEVNDDIALRMEDDGKLQSLTALGDNISECLLSEMAEAELGKTEYAIPFAGKNIVKVTFPLEATNSFKD